MDIAFTITMTEKQIPELINLLHLMQANPNPGSVDQRIETAPQTELKINPAEYAAAVMNAAQAPAAAPAIAPMPGNIAPAIFAPAPVPTAPIITAPAPMPVPTAPMMAAPAPAVIPVATPEYTAEMIGHAAAEFVDREPGNLAKLRGILLEMGVQAVTQLTTKEARAAFAMRARQLGVRL